MKLNTSPVWVVGLTTFLTTIVCSHADHDTRDRGRSRIVITDLNDATPPGSYSFAQRINESGQIAGSIANDDGNANAVVWSRQGLVILETQQSEAADINDSGVIGGTIFTDEGENIAGSWRHGNFSPVVTSTPFTLVRGISNKRVLALEYYLEDEGSFHGGLWMNGRLFDLTPLAGDTTSSAFDVNNNGVAVGYSINYDTSGSSTAVRWTNGVPVALPNLGGGDNIANAINASGHIVGSGQNADGLYRGFYIRGNRIKELSPIAADGDSFAWDLNSNGDAVGMGTADTEAGPEYHALLFPKNGNPIDLSTLPEVVAAGWVRLDSANGINDDGDIVGSGVKEDGYPHAFVIRGLKPNCDRDQSHDDDDDDEDHGRGGRHDD